MLYVTDMLTAAGGRAVNEDRCNFVSAGGAVLWALADGLGGQGGGEVASQVAADAALTSFQAAPGVSREVLSAGLEAANQAVCAAQETEPRLAGMRTTAVALAADGVKALWAHVGDSRLYHFREGRVVFQTRDHSVPQSLADAGEISPRQIRFHEDRGRLLRSLGTADGVRPVIADEPVQVLPGDAFLLASDGLWEYVTEREMEAELAKAAHPREWLRGMEARLLRRAAADHDNYSAIAIFAAEDAKESTHES
ncbi:MAG: serine/threonine-protein phosphatase [Bryobacteraceae bacterium]|nr:serine/threonine-protein phosphatase [Bryobacteraceae bacterium]